MNIKRIMDCKTRVIGACLAAVTAWALLMAGPVGHAQTAPANSSPDLQEVVKLNAAHMGDDVIIKFIANSGKSYNLSADDMVYLKSQGISDPVLNALMQNKPAAPAPKYAPSPSIPPAPALAQGAAPASVPPPAPPAEDAPPAPGGPEINEAYFHQQLSPFGSWVNVGGPTLYWRPDAALAANPDWRPYYDMGKWVQTDNGLFWQSDYNWGDIPFHYGRWVRNPGLGWLWAPDTEWGPSWVFWRQGAEADAVLGWAPLPVGAVFVNGAFMFNGVAVGVDFDFGLGEDCYTFCGFDHFHEGFFRMRGHEWGYHIGRDRMHGFYGRSHVHNDFHRDRDGRFVNHGIGREAMERATHGRLEHAGFEKRNPVGDRNKLASDRAKANSRGGADRGAAGKDGADRSGADKGGGAKSSAPSKVFKPAASPAKSGGGGGGGGGGKKK